MTGYQIWFVLIAVLFSGFFLEIRLGIGMSLKTLAKNEDKKMR